VAEEEGKWKWVEGSTNLVVAHAKPIEVDNDPQQPEQAWDEDENIELALEVVDDETTPSPSIG
jgi:hypothetical protein